MALDLRRFIGGRPVLARPSVYASTLGSRTGGAPPADRRVAAAAADSSARGRTPSPRLRRARRAGRGLDCREPGALVHADHAVSRRVPAGVRQPLLFRREPLVSRGRGDRASLRGARPAVCRPQPGRASSLPPRSQGGGGRVLPGGGRDAAAAPDDPLRRDRLPGRAARRAESALPGRLGLEPSAPGHDAGRLFLVRRPGALDAGRWRSARCSRRWRSCSACRSRRTSACDRGSTTVDGICWRCTSSPLIAVYAGLGAAADRAGRAWLSRPLYRGAALLLIVLLELLALNGRLFHYLGFSLQAWQPATGERSAAARHDRGDDAERLLLLRHRGRR